MKILVTGANGFLGQHLVTHLLNQGHEVYGLVRKASSININHPKLTLLIGSLDEENLKWTLLLPKNLEICIHTAGLVHSFNTNDFYRVNSMGTKNLINALDKHLDNNNSFHFILISSLAAHGPSKGLDNSFDLPISHYGKSKKEAEELLKNNAPKNWIKSVIRPPMVIGPNDLAVLDIFKMVKSKFILLAGILAYKNVYSFVCVFDLISGIEKVILQNKPQFLDIAFPKTVNFLELITKIKVKMKVPFLIFLPIPFFLIKLISKILNLLHFFYPLNIRLTPDKVIELNASSWISDSSLSETELSLNYNYDLDKTLDITLENYRLNKWV